MVSAVACVVSTVASVVVVAASVEVVVFMTSTTVGDCVSGISLVVGGSVVTTGDGEGASVSTAAIVGCGVGGGASTAGQNAALAGA